MSTALKNHADFALRLAFFASAPRLLVFAAALYPVTGAITQIGITLAVFFVGEWARRLADRHRFARMLLGNYLAFDAYYRAHPPRSFLYYFAYPILFPYWLTNREARREFLLYKGYTLMSFALLIVSLAIQYVRAFPPELAVADFVPIAAKTFAVETIVVLMFLMPIVTSVVHYHTTRAPRRLGAILLAGMVSSGFAIARIEKARDPIVSLATRERVRLRTKAREKLALEVQKEALVAAWNALPKAAGDVDSDGKVEGAPLEAARRALEKLYKVDETFAFDLWRERKGSRHTLVLYVEANRKKPPIWLAMDKSSVVYHDPSKLPSGAFAAMRTAADAIDE